MKPDVRVYVKRNLLGEDRTEHRASSRQTLTELIETYAADLPPHLLVVSIDDGAPIPAVRHTGTDREWSPWDRVRPRAGHRVLIRVAAPEGGGDGNLGLQIGLTLALVAATVLTYGAASAYTVPAYGAVWGGALAAGAAAAVSIGGTLALGALFPPEPPKADDGPQQSYGITGTSNQIARVGQVIPYVAGRYGNVFPLHVAQPYVTTEAGVQYMHALLSPGLGPVQMTNLRIGDAALASFPDLVYQTREGRATDAPIGLYPHTVHEAGPSTVVSNGSPLTAQISASANSLRFELTWVEGIYRVTESEGKRHPVSIQVKLEYRLLPSGSFVTVANETVTKEEVSTYRQSWSVAVAPSAAGYEGRVTRVSANDPDSDKVRVKREFYWTSFQAVDSRRPIQRDGMALLSLRVKAGPQTQGLLQRITCDCTSYSQDYDGSAWAEAPTANPASVYRAVLQHPGANRGEAFGDAEVDLARIQAWHQRCATAGRTFGMVFSDESTTLDRLQTIASAGRAGVNVKDAKISVVEDLEETAVVQAVGPHNSRGFALDRGFKRLPDALRCQFIDETSEWTRQEAVVYNDGFSALNAAVFDDLDLTQTGITNPQRVWEEGRIRLAEMQHRRWVAQQEMDLEALVAQRHELVHFMQPAALLGIADGRVKSTATSGGATTSVTLESSVLMEAGKSYALRVRTVGAAGANVAVEAAVTTVAGNQTVLTFSTPVPTASANIAAGDIYHYGEAGLVGVDAIIKSIRPTGSRTAIVEVTPHAQPTINNAAAGSIGAYDPHVTAPQGRPTPPPAPVLVALRRDEVVLTREPYGVRMVQLVAVITAPPAKVTAPTFYQVGYRARPLPGYPDNEWSATSVDAGALQLPFLVAFGSVYDVRVRAAATSEGAVLTSDWSNTKSIDAGTIPTTIIDVASVTGLEIAGQGNKTEFVGRDVHLVWRMTGSTGVVDVGDEQSGGDTTFRDPTFSHWKVSVYSGLTTELRRDEVVTQPDYLYNFDKNFADAAVLAPQDPVSKLARQIAVEVRIVDTYGRESPTPARIVVQNPAPALPSNLSVTTNIGTIWVGFAQPTDPDWIGMKVWADATSGFTPDDDVNLLGKVNACIASFNSFQVDDAPILPGTDYYVRLAAYDAFGDDPALLNISSEFAVTTASVDVSDLPEFTFDPPPDYTVTPGAPNRLDWTGTSASVIHPVTGSPSTTAVASGGVDWPGQTVFVSYQELATVLEASTDPTHHTTVDRVLMATWTGGGAVDGGRVAANNGQAQVDGSRIYAQTITGNALAVGVAIITQAAQIAAATINNAHITDLSADKLLADSVLAHRIYLTSDAGARIEIDGENTWMRVWDNQATPVRRVQIGKFGAPASYGLNVWDAAGNIVLDANGLDGVFMHDLTVDYLKIKNNAITRNTHVFGGSSSFDNSFSSVLTATVSAVNNASVDSSVIIWLTGNANFSAGAGSYRVLRNGNVIRTTAIGASGAVMLMAFDANPADGLNTYDWQMSSTGLGSNGGISSKEMYAIQFMK